MKIATLLTSNNTELPCVVLPVEKTLFPVGKEVLVYSQNRLVKGYIETEEDLIAELETIVEFAVIPELEEFIKDNINPINEIFYVQSNFKLSNI